MDNQILKAGDSFSLSPATSRLAGPLTRHRWGYEVDRDTSSEPYCPPATIFPVMVKRAGGYLIAEQEIHEQQVLPGRWIPHEKTKRVQKSPPSIRRSPI